MKNYTVKNIKEIKGDASFRKFFRKKYPKYSSIIIKAIKEKEKNLLIYDAINKILIKNNITAPKLYHQEYRKNFMEIEDLGNETIFSKLNRSKVNQFKYFKKIIKILNQIQLINQKKIKNFKSQQYVIPRYDKKILIAEANLFCDWYIKKKLSQNTKKKFHKKFKAIVKNLISNLKLRDNVFVHRDFHVSNLMLKKNQIAVIDSQDALIGNRAYDLASLVDDVRFKTSNNLKDKIYDYYIKTNKKIDEKKFKNDFEILSVLRNLKIIGIFTRLAIRDNKKKYLKLIPYAWILINNRVKNNIVFKDLVELLNQHLRKKIKCK